MKLCAIYNVWADWDIIEHSVKNISDCVDGVIIVASNTSNYGEKCPSPVIQDGISYKGSYGLGDRIEIYLREPFYAQAMQCETDKRNYGLLRATGLGYTHFIMLDADEFYEPEAFLKEKQRFIDNPNLSGLVCASQVYVKSPTLTIGLDATLVPFIHKITPGLKHEFNKNYPYAWEGRNIRIDPTRSLNINSGVEWSTIIMHHMSYVRKDIARKVRNSTAKANIERTNIVNNFQHLKEGSICEIYPGKPLVRVPNKFDLPEFYEDIQPVPPNGPAIKSNTR